jgi:hypothetical protein
MTDRIAVERDGEELHVFNSVTVRQEHHVRAGAYETFTGPILAGDGSTGEQPAAITPKVRALLRDLGVTDSVLEERGIEVVGPNSDEVTRL